MLQSGRAALPGVALHALIDPAGPTLPSAARSCFDAVYPNAYAAGLPDCFVRLAPGDDPLFAARLIQRVPSVAVAPVSPPDRLEAAVAAYWLRRSDAVVAREALWDSVSRVMRPTRAAAATAVFTAAPTGALAAALRQRGARVFDAGLVKLLSPRFGRTLFLIDGDPAEARLLSLLRRFGGDVVLGTTCLLRAYPDPRATALAVAELGRPVPTEELTQWRQGIARPGALLLGDVAAAARELYVPSAWMAAEVTARFGRAATVLPLAAEARSDAAKPGAISAAASGLQAEACVWALEMLRFWGVPAPMELDCPPGEQAGLAGLATRLGVADHLTFGRGSGWIAAELAMRGEGRAANALAAALAAGRHCVASRCLAESLDAPPWLAVVPDQASPPLLAKALRDAMAAARPATPAVTAWAAPHRDPAALLG